MLATKIAVLSLGVLFTLFGFLILFRKKYTLINGFAEDFKSGRKTERYAKRVGWIEFAFGIVLLLVGIALVIFA